MTLALAIAGVVLSLLSLLWQGYTWRRSGPVLRVTATNTFPIYGDELGDHHVTVTATNVGRAPITLTRWGISMGGREQMAVMDRVPWSTPLPHRLEPGAEASFHVLAEPLRQYRARTGLTYRAMTPWVDIAGDRRRTTKHGLDKLLSD